MSKSTDKGRKYTVTLIAIILLSAAYIGSGFFTPLQTTFGEFAMGLSGLLALYCGGNVTNKLVTKNKTPPSNEMEGF